MVKALGNYNLEIEKNWQNFWQEKLTYKWDSSEIRENSFVIDTPPPTVSGQLHMGHIFSYTQADFIARYQRMKGKTVFYPIGFDDNGLPTERLVEKIKNIRATNMSREEFIAICQEVVKDSEEDFRELFKSIALSVDWDEEYQTISRTSTKISQLSFLDLLSKEKAYRKLQPTLWDPIDQTALAQADVVDSEQVGIMNNIIFKTENNEDIIIATTRPELLAACVAVFYHSSDVRYKHLHGKSAITPLFGVKVPIIADDSVDMEKGTGLVMCCTFGDIADIAWWKTHNLPTRVIIDKRGRITGLDELGSAEWSSVDLDKAKKYIEQINGIKVKEAKAKVIEWLKEQNLITKQVEVNQIVKCAERSGAPLEILVTPQWFIKILDSKQDLLDKANECQWHPPYMKVRLDNWINGLNWDWCISRQRFFGVPFPVWYSKRPGEEGKIIIPTLEQLPIDPFKDLPDGYTKDEIEPDYDVMDTWATSSVSPQLSSHGISEDYSIDYARHKKLFPADLRPQAHEIIRTWAFYTIVKAAYHENNIPWKNLMISGWCLASDKTKMSKSKGNVVTPTKLIEENGADTVRYWASTSRLGADTAYSEDVMKIGKKLINKLWNASKFVTIHLNKLEEAPLSAKEEILAGNIYLPLDLWIISKLTKATVRATEEFEKFEYCNARIAIEDFFWRDFCDNYLEFIKVRIYNENNIDDVASFSAIKTIYICLETLLRLFAPFIPHITEEIYNSLFNKESIHVRGNWPKIEDYKISEGAEHVGEDAVSILDVVRKVKAEQNLSLKTTIQELKIFAEHKIPETVIADLANVTNSTKVTLCNKLEGELEANQCLTENGRFVVEVII
ncbi:MAG: valine--tRNA ligase [Alphaproteobacteria bacterium]